MDATVATPVGLSTGETSATRLAARRLREIATAELPSDVRQAVAVCLLDFLAACIGGLSAPWAPAVLAFATGRRGAPEAHQWGLPFTVSAETAAFANSALGHSLIYDDMHVASSSHIGVLVVPAALAMAQRDGWSGRGLVRGLAGGYEMAMRLGTACAPGRNPNFRPSGINGPFGAASAAIAATGPAEDIAVSALGFAANAAAGLNEWPWAGGQEIFTHMGMAARNGIAAFDLARAGLRASSSVLEGRNGLFNAYGAGAAGADAFIANLSKPVSILEERHKPVAGCNMIQSPVAAALMVRQEIASRVDEIEAVTIRTFEAARDYPGCDYTGPFTEVQQTKMSLQYGVAAALLDGCIDEDSYVRFSDARLQRLIDRVRIEVVPEFAASLLEQMQPAAVEVRLKDGTVRTASVEDVPWLSDEAVEARFRREAAAVLPPRSVSRIVELAHDLWQLDDCCALFDAFAIARPI